MFRFQVLGFKWVLGFRFQVFRCLGVWVFRCQNVQVFKCWGVQVFGCLGVQGSSV